MRGAHYPHDPRWLDRLDEAGILFWSETLGPAVSVANTKDWAFFMVHQKRQLSEMIDNAINHAAVFAWGWFNEGPSDHPEALPPAPTAPGDSSGGLSAAAPPPRQACPAYGACSALARARDPPLPPLDEAGQHCSSRVQLCTGSRPHALHDVGGRPQDERSLAASTRALPDAWADD